MATTTAAKQTWLFQSENGLSVHTGYPTDARGLKLRAQCGYSHVKMVGTADSGWLQIAVAIRKVATRKNLARVMAVAA